MKTIELERVGGSRPWVAEITGTDPQYGLRREFLDYTVDYSRKNSRGTRGIYQIYTLEDGVYEIKGGTAWGHIEKRRFCRVIGSESESLTFEEVIALVRELPSNSTTTA